MTVTPEFSLPTTLLAPSFSVSSTSFSSSGNGSNGLLVLMLTVGAVVGSVMSASVVVVRGACVTTRRRLENWRLESVTLPRPRCCPRPRKIFFLLRTIGPWVVVALVDSAAASANSAVCLVASSDFSSSFSSMSLPSSSSSLSSGWMILLIFFTRRPLKRLLDGRVFFFSSSTCC